MVSAATSYLVPAMDYSIDRDALWGLIDEEVSRVADKSYGEDGASLYDSVVLTSRDKNLVNGFIDDAVSAIALRTYDICKQSQDDNKLEFFVPDFDTSMEGIVEHEIDRFISMYVCSSVLRQRSASVENEYTERMQAALDKAVQLLKSRKHFNAL